MIDGWLKLIQWLTTQFGLPGSMAVALAGYLIWLLKEERASHLRTRDKIDEINEKRIEFTRATVESISALKDALQAVNAYLGKK